MLILLYGPDDYRREQKRREIVAEFEKKHESIGMGLFDVKQDEGRAKLEEFLRNQSIFEDKKLAVLENLFPMRAGASNDDDDSATHEDDAEDTSGKDLAAILKAYLDAPSTTILISEKKKPTKSFAFLLKKAGLIQEFAALAGSSWEKFIEAEAARNGLTLAPDALKFIANVFAGNTWGVATELQKLSSFKKAISLKDLGAFDLDVAPNYWGLVNGLKGYDVRSRLTALETLLALNDPAPKIFNILAASWREKTPQFAAYDRAIKSGKLEYEEALVDIVL